MYISYTDLYKSKYKINFILSHSFKIVVIEPISLKSYIRQNIMNIILNKNLKIYKSSDHSSYLTSNEIFKK